MAFSAGAVSATLRGDFNPAGFMAFDASMKRAKASMDDVEKRGGKMNKSLAAVGKVGAMAAAGGVLAMGLALGKSVKLAADFEEQLSRLKATTGASSKTMAQFKKDAMAAGAATKFSALDAAKAQVELAKGGLAVKDMGGGLKAALALAAAGEMDLAEAATATVNAMKMFKISGEDSAHVADALATAASTTTADVQDFAKALVMGGGAARTAGMSFDETIGTLEALADSSYKNSDAGTSLKAALVQLASPTEKQANAAKRLNLALWDQQGNLKSLPAMAKELDSAFGGLSNKQRLAEASTIAGTDGFRVLMALYESSPAKMEAYLAGLKKEGTAAAVAAEKQDNLKGKIENLKGSLETAGIALGEGLLPGLTEGAEKLTGVINDMAASGDLQQLGRDIGNMVSGVVGALPGIADGIKSGMDTILGVLSTVNDAVITTIKAFNLLTQISSFGLAPEVDTSEIERGNDRINKFRESLRDPPPYKVSADVGAAVAALNKVKSISIKQKVAKVIANGDTTVAQKIKALIALGIPPKTAKVITAGIPQTLGELNAVQSALGGINSKSITVSITTLKRTLETKSRITDKPPVPGLKGEAKGSRGGFSRTALVGEGVGPELVTDGEKSLVVDRPTLMDLRSEDSVIPYGDPAQSGRALGLMLNLFGIKGYNKGKKGHTHRAPAKRLPIPDAVKFGAVPEDELNASRDKARETYQKRKERVRDLDVDIREQRKKAGSAKGKAKGPALAKLRDLQADRHRYVTGPGGMTSLSDLKKQFENLNRQAAELRRVNREIDRLNTLQENDRTRMATASKVGDETGWGTAKKNRAGTLAELRERYARALKLAKPGSNFAADLAGKLAGIEGEIADADGEEFALTETPAQIAAREAADRLADTGMTDQERARLTEFEKNQSLAALTQGLDDDQAAAGEKLSFLEQILGAVQSDPARGGASAVRDIADQVKQARDNVTSFAAGGAGNDNADVAAQLAQRDEQLRVAQRESEIDRKSLAAFQGAGDIGSAGWRPSVIQNFSMMVAPTDPGQLREVGNAAVGGMGFQASRQSPRTNLGI